jgi:hypothetical protein
VITLTSRSAWSAVIGALGVNAWVSLLLIPLLSQPGVRTPHLLLTSIAPLLVLLVGVALLHGGLLLGAFPMALLLPLGIEPALIGKSIYASGAAIAFVLAATIAYTIVTLVALRRATADYYSPMRSKPLQKTHTASQAQWRRRGRLSGYFVATTVSFPLIVIGAVFLQGDVRHSWRAAFPQREEAAAVMFALATVLLWLLLHGALLARSLALHSRGDPALESGIQHYRSTGRRVPPRIYLYVGLALASTVLLWMR